MMIRSTWLGLVVAVAMLGACSSQPVEAPQVASLIPSSAEASAPAAKPKPERPRQRLDDTEADYQRLIKPYKDCMKARPGLRCGRPGRRRPPTRCASTRD